VPKVNPKHMPEGWVMKDDDLAAKVKHFSFFSVGLGFSLFFDFFKAFFITFLFSVEMYKTPVVFLPHAICPCSVHLSKAVCP
jgi:hypothetical protein